MEVIPVLDLKGGIVVHARMGMRSAYAPIETPLSPTSEPASVARGLLSVFPFKAFYVADLNAIEGSGDNTARLWPVPSPFDGSPEQIRVWLNVQTGLELDEGGAIRVLDAETWHECHRQLDKLGGPPVP